MASLKHCPAPPLNALVECFWWSERGAPLAARERMLPTGSAYLVFPLHDKPMTCCAGTSGSQVLNWRQGIVHGPQTGYYLSGPKPAGAVAGVALRPGAVQAILGVKPFEIAGRHLPMGALWGQRADSLHARLCEATQPQEIFGILENELLGRLTRPLLLHPAVAHALERSRYPHIRIEDVRQEVGFSARHFIALFHDAVGHTPGRYYRIRRFARALRMLAKSDVQNLADIAAMAGYSDQSHLIREFREHAGMTPTQYRPVDPASPHHHSTIAF
jgi:AraC-like DNA-binding protein